jgi:hypothetical protein
VRVEVLNDEMVLMLGFDHPTGELTNALIIGGKEYSVIHEWTDIRPFEDREFTGEREYVGGNILFGTKEKMIYYSVKLLLVEEV